MVRGVVIAEAGRLGTPRLLAIGDGSGGLPVRLADGQIAPGRGTPVELRGTIAAPYGQTEIRLVSGGLAIIGSGSLPVPLVLEGHALAEATEGRLARVTGTVTAGASRATSGDITLTLRSTSNTYWSSHASLELTFVPRAAFQAFADEHPEVYRHLVTLLASRLRDTDGVVAAGSFLPLKGRVARALLDLSEAFGQDVGQGRILHSPKGQSERRRGDGRDCP